MKLFSNHGKSWLSFRAFIFIFLSIIMMVTAHRSPYFQRLYNRLYWIILPAQKSVDIPIQVTHHIILWVTTKKSLMADNTELKLTNLKLRSKLQKLLAVQKENAELRQLFQSKLYISGKIMVAQLLATHLTPTSQWMLLNKGSKQNVYLNQPVLDGYGIMGQVVNVSPMTSTVLLITDQQFAIPVENYRTHRRAIAMGTGKLNKLMLINAVESTDVKLGDLFVSSGLALRFPIGYPVGVVTHVSHQMGNKFLNVLLKPSAHIDQSIQVLLNWPIQKDLKIMVNQQLYTPFSTTR